MKSRIITSTNQLTMDSSTTNASMELIPGMDMLLQYMKNQDKKIKELKKELDEEKVASLKFYQECDEELKEEIKKLKEANKEMKESIDGDGWLKQGYKTELSNSHKQQNRMVREITKLKEENKKLKEKWENPNETEDGEIHGF